MNRLLLMFCAFGLLMAGCNAQKRPAEGEVPPPEARDAEIPSFSDEQGPEPEDIISAVGTVQHVEIEGGFYGIVVGDTARYNPSNLAPEYQQDGLRVRFRAKRRTDVMTTQMWGTPVEILNIMRLQQ